MEGAVKKAEEISREIPDSYMTHQYKNPENPESHRLTTAPEILEQIPQTIDAFVSAVGTGGTLTGVGDILRQKFPNIHLVAVEPEESAVLSGEEPHMHEIQGIGPGFIPQVLDTEIYDEIFKVSVEQAVGFTGEIALKEGLLVGISSGASGFAAFKVAERLGKGKQVVTIFCDTGERYLSTGLFGDS